MNTLRRSCPRLIGYLLAIALTASAIGAKPVNVPVVYYNVGFRVEPKGRTGFAHLFEHMMFQGSANVKKFEHAKYVEANGGSLNGHTDFDYTNYFETLPSNRV